MSIDAGAVLVLDMRNPTAHWQIQALAWLIDAGWRFDDNGRVVCLPVGDADRYEWETFDSDIYRDVWELFHEKIQRGEAIGVVITWNDTMIGGELLIQKSGLLSFSASINRRKLVDSEISDASWYLERLLLPFAGRGLMLNSWEWKDVFE